MNLGTSNRYMKKLFKKLQGKIRTWQEQRKTNDVIRVLDGQPKKAWWVP
jgi:hypothetical protein